MNKRILLFVLIFSLCLVLIGCKKNVDETKIKCDGETHPNTSWLVVKEPTCFELGTKQLVCDDCHTIITTSTISMIDHQNIVDEKIEPTCEKTGLTEGMHCKICDEVIIAQEEIKALGHSYILDNELSNEEYLVYKCEKCNKTYQVINDGTNSCQNNHLNSEWIMTEEPTCSKMGSEHIVCLLCGVELEVKDIPCIDHTIIIDEEILPTCEETGLTSGSHCDTCQAVIIEQNVVLPIGHNYVVTKTLAPTNDENGFIEYTCEHCGKSYQELITPDQYYDQNKDTSIILSDEDIIVTNNNGGVIINNNYITISLAGNYSITGHLTDGGIIVNCTEEDKVTLNLSNVNITSTTTNPITINSANKVEISAQKETKNYLYDKRIINYDEDPSGAVIFAKCDLEIKGKGLLHLESTYNNGIGTSDDLEVKNLELFINVPNNALKGNDSITILSGTITAISSTGDALKTTNSDISSKGNQRGNIIIEDGIINLYAGCDGIDASYDVIINDGEINIFTENNSPYSGEVNQTSTNTLYTKVSTRSTFSNYNYSALFINEDGSSIWVNGKSITNRNYLYFSFEKPVKAKYVKFYAYSNSQTSGQNENFTYFTDQMTIPSNNDVYSITSVSTTNKIMNGSWTNYSSPQGGFGGPGGMNEGNLNEATYSCKGIKADNLITINSGIITIKSHDDAIHANNDTMLETGVYGTGSININGGIINLYTDDDAIHADNTITINNGNIRINKSYEGVEGNIIIFNNGNTEIISSDDAINAKSTLNIVNGFIYFNAGGDGFDSNGSITMTGGVVLALGPTNGGNGVIDFDRSFSFNGGLILALGCSGMNQKPTASSGNTSNSMKITTYTDYFVGVKVNDEVVAEIKITKFNQNYCVLAYNNSMYPNATVFTSPTSLVDNATGIYYIK